MNAGAVEGRNGDWFDVVGIVSDDPSVVPKTLKDPFMPLIHEVAYWGYDEGAASLVGHDAQGDFGFASSCRHNNDTSARC